MHGTIENLAETLGVDPNNLPAPQGERVEDYAPADDPSRMARTAELTGSAIRAACEAAAKSVLDLAADAEARAAEIRQDAEHFAAQVRDIGSLHAKRIEAALAGMQGTLTLIAAERVRVGALGNTQEEPPC
jgi:hypothetical protein